MLKVITNGERDCALNSSKIIQIVFGLADAKGGKWLSISLSHGTEGFEVSELFDGAKTRFLADLCDLLDDENVREIDLRELIADANSPKGSVKAERVR